jgi:hypothetical protein
MVTFPSLNPSAFDMYSKVACVYCITFYKALASVLGVAGQMMGNLSESEEEGQGRAQVGIQIGVNWVGEGLR